MAPVATLLLFGILLRSSPAGAVPTRRPASITARDGTVISMPDGFANVAFHEDFSGFDPDGAAAPWTTRWQFDVGTGYPGGPSHWGTSETQTYTASADNIAVNANGNLVITPLKLGIGGGWTSARVETRPGQDFACLPGQKLRMEAKLRLGAAPAAQQLGIWPAFWALGSAYRGNYQNWPQIGEIDILESPSGAERTWQTLHCGTARDGPCHEPTGLSSTSALSRGEWHVVAVEINRSAAAVFAAADAWKSETISWWVDGRKTFSVSGRVVGDEDAWAALAHAKHFLLLNVAVGGALPDSLVRGYSTPTAATVGGAPVAMEVEYVGVYTS